MKKVLAILICILSIFCLNVNAAKKTTKKTTKSTTKSTAVKNTTKDTMPAVVEGKDKVTVYIFTRENCGYCVAAETYLEGIKDTYGKYFDLVIYEAYNQNWKSNTKERRLNYRLLQKVSEFFNVQVNGTPYIVIGDSYNINGWDANSTGEEIKAQILKEYVNENYKDIVAEKLEIVKSEPDPHAYDGVIVAGIGIVIIAAIGVVIYFNRKNN